MEKYSVYLKKFQIAIMIIGAALALVIFVIVKTVPEVQKIMQLQTDYKTQSASLADSERKLQDLKMLKLEKMLKAKIFQKCFLNP